MGTPSRDDIIVRISCIPTYASAYRNNGICSLPLIIVTLIRFASNVVSRKFLVDAWVPSALMMVSTYYRCWRICSTEMPVFKTSGKLSYLFSRSITLEVGAQNANTTRSAVRRASLLGSCSGPSCTVSCSDTSAVVPSTGEYRIPDCVPSVIVAPHERQPYLPERP